MLASTRAAVAGAAFLAILAASGAEAQDYSLDPAFGQVALAAGFLPDPSTVALQAGGDIHVSYGGAKGVPCGGYVASAPDYRLQYTVGEYELSFYARSSADTILVINTPDGMWHCNDDYEGLDPAIVFSAPMSGQYDIWIGTYEPGAFPDATLHITELAPFSGGSSPGEDLDRTFFGQDDRIWPSSAEAPWRMIGRISYVSGGHCTGTLVGARTVLTAAHCMFGGDGPGGYDQALEFHAGASGDDYVARAAVVDYYLPPQYDEERHSSTSEIDGLDFAFLTLDRPIGEEVGWMEIRRVTVEELDIAMGGTWLPVMQGGYSADAPDVLSGNTACAITRIWEDNTIFHQCDTLEGDSGSPLFVEENGVYRIIAIESATYPNPEAEFDDNMAVDSRAFWKAAAQFAGR